MRVTPAEKNKFREKVIRHMLEVSFRPIEEVASELRITPARVYQLMTKYGIKKKGTKPRKYGALETRLRNNLWRRMRPLGYTKSQFEDLAKNMEIPKHCPVLGYEIDYNLTSANVQDLLPSFVLVNPELGYVDQNVLICCNKANKMFGVNSRKEMEKVAEFVLKTKK